MGSYCSWTPREQQRARAMPGVFHQVSDCGPCWKYQSLTGAGASCWCCSTASQHWSKESPRKTPTFGSTPRYWVALIAKPFEGKVYKARKDAWITKQSGTGLPNNSRSWPAFQNCGAWPHPPRRPPVKPPECFTDQKDRATPCVMSL